MDKYKLINRVKEVFAKGENIMQFLRDVNQEEKNSVEDILISYDLQSGRYTRSFFKSKTLRLKYCNAIAKVINQINEFKSIIEIGVGEGTTLGPVIKGLNHSPEQVFGFDISWSRLKFAKEFLQDFGVRNVKLFTANLFEIPLPDNSIDVVYTAHSLEPNGGNEKKALEELYRIAKKYVVLIEPAFEFADEEAKQRMKNHGYITELYDTAVELKYNIVEHRPFEISLNPLNPTGLTVIKKESTEENTPALVCPVTYTQLEFYNECLLFSKESSLAYPIINEIPCLLKENAILASHLLTDYIEFKSKYDINF